jgi:hypothetical protein
MADLSKEEIKSLGRAVGLELTEPLLTEVGYNLDGLSLTLYTFELGKGHRQYSWFDRSGQTTIQRRGHCPCPSQSR